MIKVRVPASTSNLGPGFDVIGLALKLYLEITAIPAEGQADEFITLTGEGADELSRGADNLIWRVMKHVAAAENIALPALNLAIHNDIPLARGLGSSAAAVVAGLKLFEAVTQHRLSIDRLLAYGVEFEGHADNIGPALLGGLVVNCVLPNREVKAVKLNWPAELRVLVVVPEFQLRTSDARAVLPKTVGREDAIFNLQRVSLLLAALQERRFDLIWESLRDRLHQPARQSLIPGLAAILELPSRPGFYGAALSGAGPTVIALVSDSPAGAEVGPEIIDIFSRHGIKARAMALEIDNEGAY